MRVKNYLITQCFFLKERYESCEDYKFFEREKTNFTRGKSRKEIYGAASGGRTHDFLNHNQAL